MFGKIKNIFKKSSSVESRSEREWKNIELNELHNLISNIVLGKLLLSRLVELMRDKYHWKNVNDLYYNPKFNTFFYKDVNELLFFHAEYETEVLTQPMYRTIFDDSIKVSIPEEGISDSELYAIAKQFCLDNNIDYYDDTDL